VPRIVTLMTDFGLKDGNVGVMKGVIWSIAPQVQIADLSHLVSPQNIPEAALLLVRSAPYFPPGTVHVVVVDPGVGTSRLPVAVQIGKPGSEQYYVGPDNGTLTLWLERAEQNSESVRAARLDQPRYWLPEVSHVFHGRDIFAPSAAHLAAGVPLEELGTPLAELVRLDLPRPQQTPTGWRGQIIHTDHFGNLASNIRVEHVGERRDMEVRVGGQVIRGRVNTFGEQPPGALVALYGSTGNLIVSVVNGSAAQALGAKVGDPIEVVWTNR
jgi:S-adenosylmethionine hydrolase